MSQPLRLRYANRIVGAFLMLFLVLCLVVSVRLFTGLAVRKDRFYVEVNDEIASVLRTGTEVVILGETVGEVDELNYVDGSNLVRVTLAINFKRSQLITSRSQVELDRKYGIGPPVLRIARGRQTDKQAPAVPIEPGGVIPLLQQDDDQVEKTAQTVQSASQSVDGAAKRFDESLKTTIQPTFETADGAFDSLRKTSDSLLPDTSRTLAQFRETTQKLESEVTTLTQRVDQLVDNDLRKTIGKIDESVAAVTEAAQSVRQTASGLNENGDETTQDIARTLETLRETAIKIQRLTEETREVVRIVKSEAEDLPGTTARINETVGEAQDLVGDINDHWLLRRFQDDRTPNRQVSPSSVRPGGGR